MALLSQHKKEEQNRTKTRWAAVAAVLNCWRIETHGPEIRVLTSRPDLCREN